MFIFLEARLLFDNQKLELRTLELSHQTIGEATLELIQFKIAAYEASLKGKDAPVAGGRKVQPTTQEAYVLLLASGEGWDEGLVSFL